MILEIKKRSDWIQKVWVKARDVENRSICADMI